MARGQRIPTVVPQFGRIERRAHSQNWYMVYRVAPGSKPIVRATKTADQQAAYDMLKDLAGKYARGEMSRAHSPVTATFNDLFSLLKADYGRRNLASFDTMWPRVSKHLVPWFGNKRVIDLKRTDIESFIASRLKGYQTTNRKGEEITETLTPASVNRLLSALHRAMTLGMQDDPPLVMRIPKWFGKLDGERERTSTMTDEQYRALKSCLPEHAALALCIAYHVGLRCGAILALKWEWVDWAANVIRIPREMDRANKLKPRVVPIYGDMRGMLEMAHGKAQSRFIIEFEGRPVKSIKTAWNRAAKLCGVPETHFHDTRRTAATNALLAGVSEIEIMEMCGWRTNAMLRRYAQSVDARAQATGQKLQEHFDRLRGPSLPEIAM